MHNLNIVNANIVTGKGQVSGGQFYNWMLNAEDP